jgi:hypothetical protein
MKYFNLEGGLCYLPKGSFFKKGKCSFCSSYCTKGAELFNKVFEDFIGAINKGVREVHRRVTLCLLIFVFIVGCNKEMQDPQVVTESVETSDFVLEVTTPTVIEDGKTLKVKGTLKYIGDKTVNLFHGGPIIRFSFTGSNETREYNDKGYSTELKPGQMIEVEDEFKVTKAGKHQLLARTTALQVDGKPIEGEGNEKFIKENMNERILELENSKLTLNPIEIHVK